MRPREFSVFAVAVVLAGCVSQIVTLDEHVKGWVGHNIEEMKATMSKPNSYASRIGWKEETYKLPNGNWIFVEPEPRCFIHWEVNQQGVIIGYKTVGESCK